MPVPLMHSNTPSRGSAAPWFTCANEFTRDCGSGRASPLTPNTTPEVPAVAATSPGRSTFSDSALFGWSPAR